LALAAPAMAEPLFVDVTETHLPAGFIGRCMDAAAGDVDGDGDLDLALAMEFQQNILLRNDGSGHVRNDFSVMPRTRHDSEDIEFADVDNDGDLDIFVVSEDDQFNELYINDGTGRFTDASEVIPVGGTSNALAMLDINGDGAIDALIGNIGADRALINDGEGRFVDRSQDFWRNRSRTQDIELADVDGDGDLDLLLANEGQNQLFLNDGDGWFVNSTGGRLPRREDETREIKAADFDGDGDLDLIVANVRFVTMASRRDYLLLNDGTGTFTDSAPANLPDGERDHFTVQAADLDDDGDIDIILPSTVFNGQAGDYRVLLNDGNARFTIAARDTVLPASVDGNGFDIEIADFDGDGRADLFLCNRASSPSPRGRSDAGGRAMLLMRRAPSPLAPQP
jgi:hypothetical protein